ncbi:protein-tyrosine phosphatase domain-containing protein [Ditylenchus destructor]|uniref:protein-tyrosine-phosphatase n=1 Tax=Ditylenchus destructor TaxID=166010 RepID=A0AAD4RA04_9BILA|nr:protein-tyrosine phosphatase domain-containing protein [Ditylenchus destructor]
MKSRHHFPRRKPFNGRLDFTSIISLNLPLIFFLPSIIFAQLNVLRGTELSGEVPFKFDTQFPDGTSTIQPTTSTLSLSQFAESFKIVKDLSDPSRLLNVYLPSSFHTFKQFIARVTDISSVIENRMRDANRTFLASLADNSLINIHGLNPGHQYTIAILGRRDDESTLIKEESVVMDPVPLEFDPVSSIQASHTNITMRATKPERALQDTFRVEYMQTDPVKRFPILDVHDIQEQKQVELYLGNLNPGRDYAVTITSLKSDLPSHPWKSIITTKPLRPSNLSVSEINSTCVELSWTLAQDSGADMFKIAYGVLYGQNDMIKTETPEGQQKVELCNVLPGQTYIFAVIAEKSHQISDPATTTFTIRPLAPLDVNIDADFEKAKFRTQINLVSSKLSKAEKCSVIVVSEHSDAIEQTVDVEEKNSTVRCTVYMDLIPGVRYEVSAATISGSKSSTKVFRSLALEPGFDFKAFGLSIQESNAGGIRIEWPASEVSMLRISDLWAKIVGNESRLHFTLNPYSFGEPTAEKESVRQMETEPDKNKPIVVEQLKKGACYKIHMYTVTSSGIVSKHRLEQFFRLDPPVVEIAVGQISKNSAMIQAFVIKSLAGNTDLLRPSAITTTSAWPEPRPITVSNDCVLKIVVLDSHSNIIYDRTLPLKDNSAPSLPLDGLRPFFKYTINSQVICGTSLSQENLNVPTCPPKLYPIQQLSFETRQDRPGTVQNLSVKALNPYSVQLTWLPPALRNGIITHYIIHVFPEDTEWEKPWNVNVAVQPAPHVFFMDDGSESLLPVNSTTAPPMEAIVDNLVGGQAYRFDVVAVTEAGAGESPPEGVTIMLPISAPPRPSFQPEIVSTSVKMKEFTTRFNTQSFSTKHGLIKKAAIIVSEALTSGGKDSENENWNRNSPNRSVMTWAQVQGYETWPPYIALEIFPDAGKRFLPRTVTLTLGSDASCPDRDPTDVCNGYLKPASNYRIKLRLFTGPTLWTDTAYSEVVATEAAKSDGSVRGAVVLLTVIFLCCLTAATIFLVCSRRRNRGTSKSCPSPTDFGCVFGGTDFGGGRRNTGHTTYHTGGANHFNANYPTKESQWEALKMIMAERAADCLAKLGLDTVPPSQQQSSTSSGSPPNIADSKLANGGIIYSQSQNTASQQCPPTQPPFVREPLRVLGGRVSPPSVSSPPATSSAEASTASKLQPPNTGNVSNGTLSANSPNGPFNIHHRRSKSLRERTGVDQRLERLPSGPPPGQKSVIWTVIKGGPLGFDKSRPVRVQDFMEHVRLMSADSDFRFSEEYEDLRLIGIGQSCIAADLSANRAKNRFTNILPYDHSRVKLLPADDEDVSDGSDYINASFIPGFNGRREFIAAQGPLPSTRDHFWRLVWEQQCPAIVALTKCVEKGRDKCHQYWPDNSQRTVLYADIEVTLLNESIDYEEFTVRELRLTNLAEPSQPSRTVQHLHYMAWPDFGVPDHPSGIVHFARLFRNKLPPSPNNKPTIVHCSAGVGRSGTFIALDRLVQNIEYGRNIDVFGTVYEMRFERCHMVQNEQQYIFIHHCLQYVLENFFPHLVHLHTKHSNNNVPSPAISSLVQQAAGFTPAQRNSNVFFAHMVGSNENGLNGAWKSAQSPPNIEVHQNPAFIEDDEGIAESGL